jgi:lipoyl(octanoyl) transferase
MSGVEICDYEWLGRVEYLEAWKYQQRLARRRARGETADRILMLEHPPVFTTGRRGPGANLRLPEEALGAPLVETDRGGDITFHGPGQLIAYPIVNLRAAGLSVVSYVRALEEAVVRTVRTYGIEAHTECGLTGVWVGEAGPSAEKIAAIGVRVGKPGGPAGGWVTTHGLALNVTVDLEWFERIVPCGIGDRGVASIESLTGQKPRLEEVADVLKAALGDVLGREVRAIESPASPRRAMPAP